MQDFICLQSGNNQAKPTSRQYVIEQAGSAFKAETSVNARSVDMKPAKHILTLNYTKIRRLH
jgi:hypothetical protein